VRIPAYHRLSPWSSGRLLDLYRREKLKKKKKKKKKMMTVARLDVPRTM